MTNLSKQTADPIMSVESCITFLEALNFSATYLVGVVLISFNDIACAYTFMEHFHFQTSYNVKCM